ncbi:hypothetical protein [Bdellovibrio bacteriovorus]|uniref:hypothetical protein n=1 Tax=Bdellovibrio bacteriovorus TaxID=959 RepID=UPI0035A73ADC
MFEAIRQLYFKCSLVLLLLVAAGCSPVVSQVKQLLTPADGIAVPAPNIAGQVSTEFYVDGKCHSKTIDIQYSLDSGTNWQSAKESIVVKNLVLECETKKEFSFALDLSGYPQVSKVGLRSVMPSGYSNVLEKTIAIDMTAPTAVLQAEGAVTNLPNPTTVLELITTDSDIFQIYLTDQNTCLSGGQWRSLEKNKLPWTFVTEGTQSVYYKVQDFARNQSPCQLLTLTVDSSVTAPTALALVFPLQSVSNELTLTVRVEGVASGDTVFVYSAGDCNPASLMVSGLAAGSTATLNATILGSDGVYSLHAKRRNSFGNESACSSASLAYSLDRIAPTGPAVLVADTPAVVNTQYVNLVLAAGDGPELMRLFNDATCSVGGSAWAPYASQYPAWNMGAGDGVKNISVQFKDVAGNISACTSTTVTLDTTPPSLTGLSSSTTAVPSHTWTWGCSEPPCTYDFVVDEFPTAEPGNNFVGTNSYVISVGSPDAFYYLHIRAKDSAGNISTTEHFLAVVGDFPDAPSTLTLLSPATPVSNVNAPSIQVAGTASGNIIDLHATVDCSDDPLASVTATGSSATLSPSLSTNGIYKFHARAFNGTNYSSCSAGSLSYTFDNSPPATMAVLDDGAMALKSFSPYLSWGPATDNLSGIFQYELQIKLAATPFTVVKPWVSVGDVRSYTFAGLSLTAGTAYKVEIRATDAAGNVSAVLSSDGWTAKAETTLPGPLCFTSGGAKGSVDAVTTQGNVAYLGGNFTEVGTCRGGLVLLNSSGGFVSTYNVAGSVSGMVSDGFGGYYVYGDFVYKQGSYTAANFIRIKADKSVDTSLSLTANGVISSAIVFGTNLYISGGFSNINGQVRSGLVHLDITAPNTPVLMGSAFSVSGSSINGMYYESSDNKLYVYGSFTSFAGQGKKFLVRLSTPDTLGASLDNAWSPVLSAAVTDVVAVGSNLFVGGYFTSVNGSPSNFLTKMGLATGTFTAIGTSFSSSTSTSNAISSLFEKGGDLYATHYSNFSRINTSTHVPSVVNSGASGIKIIGELDSKVLLGGSSGVVRDVLPGLSPPVFGSYSMSVKGGSATKIVPLGGEYLFAGSFMTIDSFVNRSNLAAVDLASGGLTAWSPSANSYVKDVIKYNGDIFAVGGFSSTSGVNTSSVTRLDSVNGNVKPANIAAAGAVNGIIANGDLAVLAGSFSGLNNNSRTRMGAVDFLTGVLDSWDPFPSSTVTQLVKFGADRFIATGSFNVIAGESRTGFAIFNNNLQLEPQVISGHTSYTRVDADADNLVISGAIVGGTQRNLACFDKNLNLIWNTPESNGLGSISVKVGDAHIFVSNSSVYQYTLGAVPVPGYTLVRTPKGSSLNIDASWSAKSNANIVPLSAQSDKVLVGGAFDRVNFQPRSGFAIVPLAGDGSPTQ